VVLPKGQKQSQKYDTKWIEVKDKIFDYDIDFSKFGWVGKISNLMNIQLTNG